MPHKEIKLLHEISLRWFNQSDESPYSYLEVVSDVALWLARQVRINFVA